MIDGFDEWRRVLVGKLEEAIKKKKPKLSVTAEQIYDNLMSQFEGGVILGKLYNNTESLVDQINQHKNYVELLFGVHD